jgi:hypothetical protein
VCCAGEVVIGGRDAVDATEHLRSRHGLAGPAFCMAFGMIPCMCARQMKQSGGVGMRLMPRDFCVPDLICRGMQFIWLFGMIQVPHRASPLHTQ